MLGLLNRAIVKYISGPRRERELERMNIKNLGYYIAGQELKRGPKPPAKSAQKLELKSKGCTQRDVESDWLGFWCSEICCAVLYHRKVWEICYVAQALYSLDQLVPGKSGLVFGCGEEPLPSLFAKYGVKVLATDLDPASSGSARWIETRQHSTTIEKLRMANVCPDPELRKNIELRYVDMNSIPADLHGKFDFCWSTCSLEHLGSIEKGLRFIEESLKTLKPGGVAVHTTEWNMNDEGGTVDHAHTVLFQKKHLLDVIERVRRQGYIVAEPDFTPGEGLFDGITDLPPHGAHGADVMHLKLALAGYRCTSWGMIIQKPK